MTLAIALGTLLACTAEETPVPDGAVTTDAGLYVLDVTATPDPPVTGDQILTLDVTDPDAEPVIGATLDLTPWMPDMNHGIANAPTVVEEGDGVYTAEFAWSMPGYWEVVVQVTRDDQTDQATLAFEVQ